MQYFGQYVTSIALARRSYFDVNFLENDEFEGNYGSKVTFKSIF